MGMTTPCKSERSDKTAIIALCGLAIVILGGISAGAIWHEIPAVNNTLLGVIVGGLMLFARECLQAIRQFWQEQRTGKMAEDLANSTRNPDAGNAGDPGNAGEPIDVNVINKPSEPVPTTPGKAK